MAALSFLDQKEVEWADLTVLVSGAKLTKITGIKSEVMTEKEHLHAGGDDPISIQSGNRKPGGSITVLVGALDIMNAAAVTAGGRDVTDLEFDIVMYYKPKGIRAPKTVTHVGCQVMGFSESMLQNDKKMQVELQFLCLRRLAV